MALHQLTFRLVGITAICLAVLLVPVSTVDRVVILTAASLGIGFASVMPGYDRAAARIVGPAVLVLALVPPAGLWVLIDLMAVFVIGFASFNRSGMARAVPAVGLPIATVAFRTGQPVEPELVLGWVLAVVTTLLLHAAAWPVEEGPPLSTGGPHDAGSDGSRPVIYGRRRLVQALALLVLVAPVSIGAAGFVDRELPSFVLAQPRLGDLAGVQLRAHPGLTGGLDAGSPVSLSDDVVLRVRADRPLYWRGTTYDRWDGRRWSSHEELTPIAWSGDGVRLPDGPDPAVGIPIGGSSADGLPEPTVVLQQFTVERAGMDVILAAWRPRAMWASAERAELGRDGSIRLDEPLGAGATWTVESSVVPASEDDLRRADPRRLPPTSPILARFAVEDDVTPEVAELARSVTADAETTYDAVRALEAWMDANVSYTRDIPRLADGEDAVDHLLFESRQGYCEQIGSALVVMLRSLGIPARLAVGYVPGEYDSATGEWLSRGTDAHAWAEVYFPGVGWQGFDPTAGVPATTDGPGPSPVVGDLPLGRVWVAIAAVVAVIALAGRFGATLARLLITRWPLRRRGGDSLVDLQRRFDACGADLELLWPSSMTLREKGEDLVAAGIAAESVHRARASLEQLWYLDAERLGPEQLADGVARATLELVALERAVAEHTPAPAGVGAR